MVHYERLVGEIKEKLGKIRNDYLAEAEGVCHQLADGRVLKLPDDYWKFVLNRLDDAKRLKELLANIRYKSEEARCSAEQQFNEISGLVNLAKPLDDDLRLLLDRGAMRALFRRPRNDEFKWLNVTAHPSKKICEDPKYSATLLWMSRWPDLDHAGPDTDLKHLQVCDQSLLTYYATQPLPPEWKALHASTYLQVCFTFGIVLLRGHSGQLEGVLTTPKDAF